MSKICNVCGSMNNDTQQTCAVCGSALIQASAPEQPKIKYPIYENTDYAAIAARDAAKQASAQQRPMQPVQQRPQQKPAPQNKQPQKKNLTPIIISVVAAVVVVAVALGVIFGIVLPSKEEKDKSNTTIETVDGDVLGIVDGKLEIQPMTKTLTTSGSHTVALKSDGTIVAIGFNDNDRCDVDDWTDIVAVETGGGYTVGLKADGTLLAVGWNVDGQCNVDDWSGIVAVSAGGSHTVGLKADGTVVAIGDNDNGQCDVDEWTNIVAVSAGDNHTVGLKADGTVIATNFIDDPEKGGSKHTGQCNVDGWHDIVAISAGGHHTVGLKSDGTVISTDYINASGEIYNYNFGQCNVNGWSDIVAVSAGKHHTVGLKSDGTVVSTKFVEDPAHKINYNQGQCDVEEWTNIVAVEAGHCNTVGLKADGTVISTNFIKGYYSDMGQCNVDDWSGIKVIVPNDSKVWVNGGSVNNQKPAVVNPTDPIVDVTVPVTEVVTVIETKPVQNNRLTATDSELEELTNYADNYFFYLSNEFDYQTLDTGKLYNEILFSIAGARAYSYYFDDCQYVDFYKDNNAERDPLDKFYNPHGGYIKVAETNIKWLCENIYHIEYNPNYASEESYYYDGYFYSRYGQVGLGEGGSAEIKSYKQLEDGRYEVIFDYCEYQYQVQERTEEYKVIADIQMIDGERMWTFYSVEKIFDMYGD